jgi:hypothetical protein
MEDDAPEYRRDLRLVPPVTFDPDVAAMALVPVTGDPVGVGVGWFDVGSGDPDVAVTVPAMVAIVPGPARVFVRRDGDNFDWTRRGRADSDDDLGLCNACNK